MDTTISVLKGFVYFIGFGSLLFLSYITTRFLGTKMNKAVKGKHLSVVDSVTLGLNKQLYLVKAGNQFILMASSGKSLEFITEIKLDDLDVETDAPTNNVFDFKTIFEKYISNNKNKKAPNEKDTTVSIDTTRFKGNLQKLKILSSKFGKPVEDYGDDNTNEK